MTIDLNVQQLLIYAALLAIGWAAHQLGLKLPTKPAPTLPLPPQPDLPTLETLIEKIVGNILSRVNAVPSSPASLAAGESSIPMVLDLSGPGTVTLGEGRVHVVLRDAGH